MKNGKNPSGSQRWFCQDCQRTYTPKAMPMGYGQAKHRQALRLYLEGMSYRAIGRMLEVHHQTVINWVEAHAAQLPEPPMSDEVAVVELDELYTFVEKKAQADTACTS